MTLFACYCDRLVLFLMAVCGRDTRRCFYSLMLPFHLTVFYSEVSIAVYIAPVLGSTTGSVTHGDFWHLMFDLSAQFV